MFKTFRDALRVKEIRDRLLFTLLMLVVIRIGSAITVPYVDTAYLQSVVGSNTAFDLLNTFSGGSFEKMTIFALSISPYITSSIIVQLLAIAIPKLEEMSKDGETGRKKMEKITRYGSIVLALIESVAMCIGFINGAIVDGGNRFFVIMTITLSFTAGSAFLMWLGERITDKGVGNGISMILLFGIVASFPSDVLQIKQAYFGSGHKFVSELITFVICVIVVLVMVVATVYLQDGTRRIAVQYAKKVQGRKMVGGQSSFIPIKVNTAGVIPVIFSMSLMSFPQIISGFFGSGLPQTATAFSNLTGWQKVLCFLSSSYWFNFSNGYGICTLGVLLYIALNIFFAYFYTAITFNPNETANNLKTNSGFVPGIRPGRPTADYLTKVLNYIIFIGAIGLTIVALLPIVISGLCGLRLSFGGTSIIIVVGVILETMQQVESMMVVRHYRGFLSE